ncbi:hypothetical protein KC660_03035, partial [Candidatus Dojkabacteria bacterium]|nr:hypothetical protein [Candidatus Dojkabacteria bacterium]
AGFIRYGRIRENLRLKLPEAEFFDHGYNLGFQKKIQTKFSPYLAGFSDSDGNAMNFDYQIPDDNTNPDGYFKLFTQDPNEDNALSKILKYDMIIFKSCFPVTKITSDQMLNDYKHYFEEIKKVFLNYPEKTFLALTPPPLRSELTKPEYAARARIFSNWLVNEFPKNLNNTFALDVFDLLAEKSNPKFINTLKRDFCKTLPFDSHPNREGSKMAGEELVEKVRNYK